MLCWDSSLFIFRQAAMALWPTLCLCVCRNHSMPETLLTGKEGLQKETRMGKYQSDSRMTWDPVVDKPLTVMQTCYEGREQCPNTWLIQHRAVFAAEANAEVKTLLSHLLPVCSCYFLSAHLIKLHLGVGSWGYRDESHSSKDSGLATYREHCLILSAHQLFHYSLHFKDENTMFPGK